MPENKDQIINIIKQYIALIRKNNIKIEKAYLFGSYANGNPTDWSDIDVAVVTDRFIGDRFDFQFLLMKIAREIDPDIDPHPFLIDDFNENNPIAVEILRTGEKVI